MSITDRLKQLRQALPRKKGPFLYAHASDMQRSTKRIKVYAVLLSEENTAMLAHIIVTKRAPHPIFWWSAWCSANVVNIFRNGVLPGLNLRTAKAWHVDQWLGFSLTSSDNNAVLAPAAPSARRKGNRANKTGK